LARWSGWVDLRGAGRNREIPDTPGLYRIRRAGDGLGLEYIGQTGRSLRGRLGRLARVYGAQMPYRDPHTAGPALWALPDRDGCDFQASVIQTAGPVPERKALATPTMDTTMTVSAITRALCRMISILTGTVNIQRGIETANASSAPG
jgi:hypothetical protein